MMKKVSFKTLGCRLNQYETDALVTQFHQAGYQVVDYATPADITVINTCTVTKQSDQKSRNTINHAARKNAGGMVVVTGCMANNHKEQLEGNEKITYVVDNERKSQIVSLVDAHFKGEVVHPENYSGNVFGFETVDKSLHTRTSIKVQDGCDNFCTYCIVPYTRGRSRSLPMDQVLEQVRVFAEEGYLELVITGINVGKYGLDLEEGEDIYSLLETICRDFPSIRIRLSSVEPTEVNDRLLELMTGYENFMPHLHIPLQSGDDGVLVGMNRRYTTETFVRVIQKIRTALPHGAIGCDILGGFPGEDEQAAENTFRLIEGLPISYLHVFPYSKRPRTLASEFKNQVAGPVKAERVARLRELGQQKRKEFYRCHVGTEQNILVERKNKKTGLLQGFSENYIPVHFRGPAGCIRTVVRVRIDRIEDGEPQATLLE